MPSEPALRWRVFADADALAEAAAAGVIAAARAAIARCGAFHLVLAGGTTPLPLYRLLAASGADVRGWHLYPGDERCLPRGDPGRNDSAIRAHWLDRIDAGGVHFHALAAEAGATEGARRAAADLAGVGDFDLVLLGLGDDGHVASLFPGLPQDAGDAQAVHAAPKPPAQRVSLSAARLSRTRAALLLATGAAKAAALGAWRAGAELPVAHIRPPGGLDVWLDRAAAGGLPAAAPLAAAR